MLIGICYDGLVLRTTDNYMDPTAVKTHVGLPLTQTPPVTVLVSTCNRGDSIVATIKSILACTYPNFKIIIIDQSRDLRTTDAIGQFAGEPALRYIHIGVQGKSRSNNIGLALSTAEFILLTDDDCEVSPDWISEMVAPFLCHPAVGIVFCNVIAAPHDKSKGSIPVNVNPKAVLVKGPRSWQTSDGVNLGIGAGMAIRRTTAEALHGFNPLFGPGSRFRSGDDVDFTLRALLAGYQIYRTNTVDVIHHGFRTYEQGRRLLRNNSFGLGGIHGQLLRHGHWFALYNYISIYLALVIHPAFREMLHRRPPRVVGRAIWLARGFIEGLLMAPLPSMCDSSDIPLM